MKKWPWFVIAVSVIFLDQISKYWASHALILYHQEPVFPMLNMTLAYNTGAAFSFLRDAGEWSRWLFAGFSAVMSIILVVAIVRTTTSKRLQLLALSLILGGAIGNLIDRALLGHVIDFIEVYYHQFHWPVFNIADSAICIGAFLLFLQGLQKDGSA